MYDYFFGIEPPVEHSPSPLYWGARALLESSQRPGQYRQMEISLLYGRMQMLGGTVGERERMALWINNRIAELTTWVNRKAIRGNSNMGREIRSKLYTIRAEARGGYLYLGAWRNV